ncbi:hypothetical protein GCM10020220_111090 [Nonomuraea rubra]
MVYEFDVRKSAYTGRTWTFRADETGLLVGDAAVLDGRRLMLIERDNEMGPSSRVKRLVVNRPRRRGAGRGCCPAVPPWTCCSIADPKGGLHARQTRRSTGWGRCSPSPLQSVESVLPLGGDRVVVANDNNFPGNDGRIPGRADDTEVIVIDVPGLRG